MEAGNNDKHFHQENPNYPACTEPLISMEQAKLFITKMPLQ